MNLLSPVKCLGCGKRSARLILVNGVLSSYCYDCGITLPVERVSLSTSDHNSRELENKQYTGQQKEGL
jgi:hypothetical protein